MGNFEERFLSDKLSIRQDFYQTRFLSEKMGAFPTFLLLVLLTWTAQQSICKPHHGEPHKESTTPVPESLFHSHPTSIPPEFPSWCSLNCPPDKCWYWPSCVAKDH